MSGKAEIQKPETTGHNVSKFVRPAFPESDHDAIFYLTSVNHFDNQSYAKLLHWYCHKPRCYSHVLQAPFLWGIDNPAWLNKFLSPKAAMKDLKMPWQLRWIPVNGSQLMLLRRLLNTRTDFGLSQKPKMNEAIKIHHYLRNLAANSVNGSFGDWMIKKLDMENMEMKMTHFSSLRDLANYKRRHNQAWPHKWTVQQALAAHDRMVAEQNKTRLDQYDGRTEHWPEDLPRELTLADGSVLTACTTQQRMVRESLTYGHCCGHGIGEIYWKNQVKGVGAIYHMDCANGHGYTVEVRPGNEEFAHYPEIELGPVEMHEAAIPSTHAKLVRAWVPVQIQGKSGTRPGDAVTSLIIWALRQAAQRPERADAPVKASDGPAPSSEAPRV